MIPHPERLRALIPLLALVTGLAASAAPAQERPFLDTVRRSGFIFLGTVEELGKATESIVPRPESAVVRVDRVLESSPPIGDPTGQRVTVRLRRPQSVQPGSEWIFFTYLESAGETLELSEVAREEAEPEELAERIAEARRELADQALTGRLEKATAVIVGTVVATLPARGAARPESEHDPLWWRAKVEVERVVAGRLTAPAVPVHFATNFDYRWAEAPRLEKGETALLLLQPDPDPEDRVSGYFLLDPLDKLSTGELARVQRLLETIR